MHLRFGPDDDEQFHRARTDLLDRFEAWLAHHRPEPNLDAGEAAGEAGLALDWKWGYGDGDLGRWSTADVREFLLDWCPRKLSAGPEESASIPLSLAAFTGFLGDQGLLAPGSSPVDDLVRSAVDLAGEFLDAMDDPANFGMAKSLFAAAAGDGVDLSDPERVQDWIDDFNAQPEDERRRLIPGPGPGTHRRPAVPPVVPPDDAEVATSRAAAPILAKFAALAQFAGAGSGRKLTQKGNLSLADARSLVALLETGDVMDPVYGSRTFRTTSSAELRTLHHIFIWAKKAGVVRVAHGRMIATKKGLAIAKDPAAFFDRAVDALLKLGALASQRDPDGWLAWPDVTELLDRFTVHLLTGPYVAQRPLPIEDLCDVATEAVLSVFRFPNSADDRIARHIAIDVIDMVDALELAGVVRRTGTGEPDDPEISRRREGGSVELTPAGVVTTRRLLVEAGYEAPTAGRLTDATATELLLGTDTDDFPAVAAEIEAWRRRRTPAEAAAELADAVRELADPALRNLALAVLGQIGPEIAGPEVRTLATEPGSRGFALCWLVDHGLAEPGTLFDPDDVSWFVDVLAHRLVTVGPDGLCDTLALAGDHQQQVAVIGRLWRSPSVATELVLAALGQVHPVKAVAKAARKALFQRRSWSGPS
jgi:hypothetical protein